MPTYKMRSGDTPEKVSARFGMNVLDLYKANRGTYQYKTGTTIKVPGTGRRPATFGKTKPPTTQPTTRPTTYVDPIAASRSSQIPTTYKPVTNKPTGVVYPTAEEIYESSGANTREADWSATMGANLGEVTAENWAQGYRPERMTVTQAKNIGVADNWMRENGYVLIGDTWCLSAQTKYYQEHYASEKQKIPMPTPPPTTTTASTNLGPYTENTQWRVSTG